jgi:hypothetical protein
VRQAWLKPFGDSKRPIRNDWINEFLLDPLETLVLMTGPSERRSRPAMCPRDRVVLHAVGHGRVFAAGQIESGPIWAPDRDSRWDPERWPWIYHCRVDTWVPLVDSGPRTWDYAARVKGQIQFGRWYAELTSAEHGQLLAALSAAQTVSQLPSR